MCIRWVAVLALLAQFTAAAVWAAEPTQLKYSRAELETHWRGRIQAQLDQGKLPKIDMETSIKEDQAADDIPSIFETMDRLGIALSAFDGYQRPKDDSAGYRWSSYIIDLVNRYPDRIVPTANGGTNPNWLKQKGGNATDFIDQMEKFVRAGVYVHMGEFDFRHYQSSTQCQKGDRERDVAIPLDGENGRRVFKLSEETGVPFVIHLEPEDAPLQQLETMLKTHPKAKVIVAHFGQVRHPEIQKRFTPETVRHLLSSYPNLYYDLATGQPNRKYKCAGPSNSATLIGDTALWDGGEGSQTDTVKPAWRAILNDFSDRFVFATDYGGGRPRLPRFLDDKAANFDRIVRDLPDAAKHNIAYKNAWKLLTGKSWN